MSAIRILGIALTAAAAALPSFASENVQLRGRLEADFLPAAEQSAETPVNTTNVAVKEADASAKTASKKIFLRYLSDPEMPDRIVAESRGQDPDRVNKTAAGAR
jgi:hypothetical protein